MVLLNWFLLAIYYRVCQNSTLTFESDLDKDHVSHTRKNVEQKETTTKILSSLFNAFFSYFLLLIYYSKLLPIHRSTHNQ